MYIQSNLFDQTSISRAIAMKIEILIQNAYGPSIHRLPKSVNQPAWGYDHLSIEWHKPFFFLSEKLETLDFMLSRAAERKKLVSLSDHILKDVGLTREQVMEDANKWFWQD